jgi:hypothetical protein
MVIDGWLVCLANGFQEESMTSYVRPARRVLAVLVAGALYAAPAQADSVLVEDFDDVSSLGASGWVQVNDSALALPGNPWFQGNSIVFDAESGAPDSYIATNYASAGDGSTVSNWLLLPEMTLDGFTQVTFFTRSAGFLPDRLEVRVSTNGASTSLSDFGNLFPPINPALNPGGYPTEWTQYTLDLGVLLSTATTGRIAFRYFIDNNSAQGDYVGIDSLLVKPVPEPATMTLLGLGLAGLAVRRRRANAQKGA